MLLIMLKIMVVAWPFVKELVFGKTNVLTAIRNNRAVSVLSMVAGILLLGFVFMIDISISLYDQLDEQKQKVVQLEKKLDTALEVKDRQTPDTVEFIGRLARMEESLSILEDELETVTAERDALMEKLGGHSSRPSTSRPTKQPRRTLRDVLRAIRDAEKD